ncbi:unnamed protein product, partial [Ceratitis capitata]
GKRAGGSSTIQQVEEENNNISEDEVVEEIENVDVLPGGSEDYFESSEEEHTPMKRGRGRPKLVRTG